MIKAIVFDFDGLILDTETPWYDAINNLYGEHGLELPIEQYAQCVGSSLAQFDPYSHLEQAIDKAMTRDEISKLCQARHQEMMQNEKLRPGVLSYLDTAQSLGLKIGLASSSTGSWVIPLLKKHGIFEYFDCIHTADHVEEVKPNPALYLLALNSLGVEGPEAIAFEDSLHGLRAAKAAGMYCVVVPNRLTIHFPFANYDMKIGSMADMKLTDMIEKLEKVSALEK
ncbi:HAD family phosphatase [Paenibacillus sp. MSJ-34]|uniref:HAD family hydrolase n=1 Tax=Paenibacillus sp. MSJ-34 TaxID=2841529 RepID=UPI001C122011|nr:HAD family hydrolase [Paenibacillus sp. MSJ-34]MBU5445317.1 HAD family hydrolase [Paenibacillus sp. MSJ-34]